MLPWSFSSLTLLTILFECRQAAAWFRVACSTTPLVQERLDPIVSPGISPSNHVHTIHGGNKFASNSTYDILRTSTCSNCLVAQARFPKLYLRDPKTGMFEPVPDGGGSKFLPWAQVCLLVYYQNRGNGDVSNGGPGLKAFPPGLKMVSGNPARRSRKYTPGQGSQEELAERAIEWECLRYTATTGYNSAAAGSGGFPTTDCEAGLNARIHFPACWDGVNLDSDNHASHTAYLSDLDNGACPSTHPVPFMKLLYEVTWDVHSLASRWDPQKDTWPFVWGTDPTGYSWHGDFQNGWDTDTLQNAIDKCNNPNDPTGTGITEACSFLTTVNATLASQCQITPIVNEAIDGQLEKLPGCNPLQFGPEDAIMQSDSNCKNITSSGGSGGSSAGYSIFACLHEPTLYISLVLVALLSLLS
ncbi:hypothetical protein BDN70DRAFT_965901 [Pholiota conissans]|uniref:DUF1996 domain-containing protein n=1 Tax=Pholiota conissans TaxID=109636 RepID=A0A9P6CV70_9AGAR|nr:hypothetical protein BDN70DRAFT_965901 [Pholiota conissans]